MAHADLGAGLTRTEREALKALHRRTVRTGDGAHTGLLAEALSLSPATITASLKRLDERGLVVHRPYHGSELTDDGRREAARAVRRHRIVERFQSDLLGYPWHESDRLAPSFEHDLPQEVEDRLFLALGCPITCPHGFPIPAAEASDVPATPELYALEPGDEATIAVPGSVGADVVAFLDAAGIRPGVRVRVREKHPFDGPLELDVDGERRIVGEHVARQIYVHEHNHRKESA